MIAITGLPRDGNWQGYTNAVDWRYRDDRLDGRNAGFPETACSAIIGDEFGCHLGIVGQNAVGGLKDAIPWRIAVRAWRRDLRVCAVIEDPR